MSLAAATVEWARLRADRSKGPTPAREKRQVREHERQSDAAMREQKMLATLTVGKICETCFSRHIERNRSEKGSGRGAANVCDHAGRRAGCRSEAPGRVRPDGVAQPYPRQAAKLRAEKLEPIRMRGGITGAYNYHCDDGEKRGGPLIEKYRGDLPWKACAGLGHTGRTTLRWSPSAAPSSSLRSVTMSRLIRSFSCACHR
jgi:hypothetical protein